MSTKTTFKRIALVAVAALGLGVLSVAPSNAVVLSSSLTIDATADAIKTGETATAVLTQNFTSTSALDSTTVLARLTSSNGASTSIRLISTESSTATADTQPTFLYGITSPSVAKTAFNPGAVANVNTGDSRTVVGHPSGTVNVTWSLQLYSVQAAGTYTVDVYTLDAPNPGEAGQASTTATKRATWTVTVTDPDKKSAGNSTATVRTGTAALSTGTAEGTDSAVVATKTATGAAAAVVWVRLKNATSTADESITAVISGNGYISADSTRSTNTALTLRNPSVNVAAGVGVYVFSNGTAGTATLTLSTPSIALATKTFTFSGAASKLAIATDPKAQTIGRTTGGYSNASQFKVKVTDANGNIVSGLSGSSFVATSSNALAVASASVGSDDSDGLYPVSYVTANGATSGAKSTITVKYPDPADTTGATYLTAVTQDVTLGGAVNKVTITTDKASYTPGEQMIVTVTAVDSSGNPVADGRTAPTLSSNKTVTGLANVATTYTGGKADSIARGTDGVATSTYRVFAPSTGGAFEIYADYADAAAVTQRATVTATVSDAALDAATDAANEATDAANAATDAALAAADAADAATAAAQDASDAVAALSASVSKLISQLRAQITSLTNLVIKIQKKVKA